MKVKEFKTHAYCFEKLTKCKKIYSNNSIDKYHDINQQNKIVGEAKTSTIS